MYKIFPYHESIEFFHLRQRCNHISYGIVVDSGWKLVILFWSEKYSSVVVVGQFIRHPMLLLLPLSTGRVVEISDRSSTEITKHNKKLEQLI